MFDMYMLLDNSDHCQSLYYFHVTGLVIMCSNVPRGCGGGGVLPISSIDIHMYVPPGDDFSLTGHLTNDHLISICPSNSLASQIMIDQKSLDLA